MDALGRNFMPDASKNEVLASSAFSSSSMPVWKYWIVHGGGGTPNSTAFSGRCCFCGLTFSSVNHPKGEL
jgi:hypothetical protein